MQGTRPSGEKRSQSGANHSLSRVWRKGQKMKKLLLSIVAAAALATPALAADLKLVTKAPPPPPSPWDVAFGAALTSDYLFRGITQSNHRPSVFAYFEPRYNVTKDLQLYAGIAGASISFPNRAAAEVDFSAGIRPTFGPLALDFGAIYYWYPGGQCFNGSLAPVFGPDCLANGYLPVNVNVIKADLSFWEVYAKGTCTVNDQLALGGGVFYSNRVLNSGADGTYVYGSVKFTAPSNAAAERPGALCVRRGRPLVPGHQRQLLLHAGRRRGMHPAVPERHSLRELHHLEHRLRHHQERVHARLPLLRHRPEQGRLQRLHQRPHRAVHRDVHRRSIRAGSARAGAASPSS